MSKAKVRCIDTVRQLGKENLPVYKSIEVDTDFVRCYYNMYASLAGLNPCSRDLMDFLVKEMDDNNIVRSDRYVRTKFLDHIASLKKPRESDGKVLSYADSNVKKSFRTLSINKCLIPMGKGLFKVNPEIYFRKSEAKRLQSIKFTMEFIKGFRDTNMILQYSIKDDGIEDNEINSDPIMYNEEIPATVID